MSEPRFLVTGAHGCIGAWVVHELVEAGSPVVTFDLSTDARRVKLLLGPERAENVPHVAGDITDLEQLERTVDEHGVTNIIHLAALQVPFCRADPPLGARVNVLGTVNIFELAKKREGLGPIVYASSVAAFDAYEEGAEPSMSAHPSTIYGVYKRANEGTAWVYATENGVASVGLRPHTVYGVGRDQGLTSAPTTAMLAAAAGVPFTIPYGGRSEFQFGRDVAQCFIAASLAKATGSTVHNLPGMAVSMDDVVDAIGMVAPGSDVRFEGAPLPFPEEVDSTSFTELAGPVPTTPFADGVAATVQRFRELLTLGLVTAPTA